MPCNFRGQRSRSSWHYDEAHPIFQGYANVQGETVIAMPTGSLAFGRCIYALEIDETFAENCISENCVGY